MTEKDIIIFQEQWGKGVVKIGEDFSSKKDYAKTAKEFVKNFYDFTKPLLFKPTLASETQFRTDFESALSYFIGNNDLYSEDKGFALKCWNNVRWENKGIRIINNMAYAMGNYYFKDSSGQELKVEFSFVYILDDEKKLKIVLHEYNLPYKS